MDLILDNLTRYYGTDYLMAVFAFIGTYYLGKHNKMGFVHNGIAALLAIAFGVMAKSFALIFVQSVLLVLYIHGYQKWKRKEAQHATH